MATPIFADPAFLRALPQKLDADVLDRWQTSPEWVLDDVIEIAFGYGEAQALTEAAIETFILHQHANARARALQDLLEVDLNGDLAVSDGEVASVALSLDGYWRGHLWTRHRRADVNNDGLVTFDELQGFAKTRAKRFLGPKRAQALRALVHLDMDADGRITVAEAELALHLLSKSEGVDGPHLMQDDA